MAEKAFINLTSLLKPRSALIINGMDYDMRIGLTRSTPWFRFPDLIEEVHNRPLRQRRKSLVHPVLRSTSLLDKRARLGEKVLDGLSDTDVIGSFSRLRGSAGVRPGTVGVHGRGQDGF